MTDVNLVFKTESEVLNALPSGAIITTWENNMKSYGATYMASPPVLGASLFDDERTVAYYDGARVFYLQYLYWTGRDNPYAADCLSMSNYLWAQYESVYGAFGLTSVDPRYKNRSQWVFPASALQRDFTYLEDMCFYSSYGSYTDGHVDAYLDSDARGIGYLLDALCSYKEYTGNDPISPHLSSRNELESLVAVVSNYCENLGPVDGKTKEVFFQLGIMANAIMRHRYTLKPYFRPYQKVSRILEYLIEFIEPVNDYRINYGDGFIDDGVGGNEAIVYYAGLEMIIAPAFQWHKKFQTYADGLFSYAVNNAPLNQAKDYVQSYRWAIEYVDRSL